MNIKLVGPPITAELDSGQKSKSCCIVYQDTRPYGKSLCLSVQSVLYLALMASVNSVKRPQEIKGFAVTTDDALEQKLMSGDSRWGHNAVQAMLCQTKELWNYYSYFSSPFPFICSIHESD